MRRMCFSLLCAFAFCFGTSAVAEMPPPPDAAVPAAPVPPDQRLVLTYYYYWYDATTGAHMREADGFGQHFPDGAAPSWRSAVWHQRQLADMAYAGIDMVLPVYWGFDRAEDAWSPQGLGMLSKAWDALSRAGRNPPRIGMFFDTGFLKRPNLTTPQGKAYFYANFKDFFQRIPRRQWAMVNGGPTVFLFTSDFVQAVDQSTFDYVYSRFEKDFGVKPYIVREVSWDYPFPGWDGEQRLRDYRNPIRTENNYLWAASIFGYVDRGGVAAVGPGYDDSKVPGRHGGRVTKREGGDFYRKAFEAAIASGKPIIAIETWNEFHEGSGIAESKEYGRKYLDITREYTARFHRSKR